MSSVASHKSHSSCKSFGTKCPADISLDTSRLSVRTSEANLYENTPSPSSIASTSTIDHSIKDRHRILSSTLKNDHSQLVAKRRSRFERLFHHTQLVNRQYMMTMTNILLQMQREIHRLKRRTHRVEQSVVKQTTSVQPIIRIPRLTKDELCSICIHDDETDVQENEPIPDANNNHIGVTDHIESKANKGIKRLKSKYKQAKASMALAKRGRRRVWINHRQKPIDPRKYCSLCRREFSKRSSFITHVKNIHNGQLPLPVDEQDQSLLEMSEENTAQNDSDHGEHDPTESTHDQSAAVLDDVAESPQPLTEHCDVGHGRLRSRATTKPTRDSTGRLKVKCSICNKFYRADYIKKHQRRAHPDQEILLALNDRNNSSSDQVESISDAPRSDNQASVDGRKPGVANTPRNVTIASMEADDAPIRFRRDSTQTIVLAVTCLESDQLATVEEFLKKFSSRVSQAAAIDSRTTHLVTNDEKKPLRSPLSMKLIEAIAHHCFCVSYRWVKDCLEQERIVDESPYEIEGDDTDVNPHGGPCRSRLIPTHHSLFTDMCFMIKCAENSDIRMTNERLEDLITTCGGQIITCVTQRLLDQYQIIVLCDVVYVSERRHNYDQCRALGIQFVSSDWVLESILEYRRKPFSLFEEVPL